MQKLSGQVDVAADLLSALANPKRLLILCNLIDGEMSAGELAVKVLLSQPALSQHLAKLRAQGLVTSRRDRQTLYYSCTAHQGLTLLAVLEGIYNSNDAEFAKEIA